MEGAAVSPGDEARVVPRDEELIGWGPFKVRRYIWVTFLIVNINIILFADTNLLAPVLTPIAREFGFVEKYPNGTIVYEYDDRLEQVLPKVDADMRDQKLGGDITLAFFLIGGSASLIVGYLTDVVNRRNMLATVVVLGESSCLATYFTTTYWGLFITRALTGVAVGGAIPLVFSLFGDLFSVKHRGKAVAAAGMAIGAGTGVGQVLAGPIAGEDGKNWRLSFVFVAIPAYILAALLMLTVDEPPRGGKEEANSDGEVYDEKVSWAKIRKMLSTPTVVLVLFQGIPGSLPWGIFGGFLSDFLAEEKNIDIRLTGIILMLFGIGNMLGAVVAGYLIDRWFKPYMKWVPVFLGVVTSLGAIPMAIYVSEPIYGYAETALFVVPAGFLLGFAGNSTKTILVNVCPPETRGSAFSVLNLFDDLGKGLGVFVLARFFSLFTATAEQTARQQGMTVAFLVGWPACGLTIACMYFFIERDYERCQAHVGASLEDRKSKEDSLNVSLNA